MSRPKWVAVLLTILAFTTVLQVLFFGWLASAVGGFIRAIAEALP